MAGASPKLEDVVVTARERRGSKMKIPVSITMTSDQRVARQNIKDLNRIGLAVLNVNLSMRSDRYPNAPIRGIGAFGLSHRFRFQVSNVKMSNGDARSRFGDIERIEVPKGPQGTIYGGSDIGGASNKRDEQTAFRQQCQNVAHYTPHPS